MTSTSSQSDALPNSQGRFGPYGGKFVPETLMAALAELETAYDEARQDDSFWSEFEDLLKNYVGRPTAMYHAKNLTEQLGGAEIYIKREDLNHTGAHKINNAIGQALLALLDGATVALGGGSAALDIAGKLAKPLPEFRLLLLELGFLR